MLSPKPTVRYFPEQPREGDQRADSARAGEEEGHAAGPSFGIGKGNHIELSHIIKFPHSLGLLYSAFTYFTGFKVNSGEYKLMGLAPYGEPKYYALIVSELIDLKEDSSFHLYISYFPQLPKLFM